MQKELYTIMNTLLLLSGRKAT